MRARLEESKTLKPSSRGCGSLKTRNSRVRSLRGPRVKAGKPILSALFSTRPRHCSDRPLDPEKFLRAQLEEIEAQLALRLISCPPHARRWGWHPIRVRL
jgi:hypothetical protein